MATFLAWLSPGEKVLIPNPLALLFTSPVYYWSKEGLIACLAGNKQFLAILVRCDVTHHGGVTCDCANYPNNSTGAVLPYDEIAGLAKITVERDLIVISESLREVSL